VQEARPEAPKKPWIVEEVPAGPKSQPRMYTTEPPVVGVGFSTAGPHKEVMVGGAKEKNPDMELVGLGKALEARPATVSWAESPPPTPTTPPTHCTSVSATTTLH